MAEQYVVTGPLAIATTQEGAQVYVYQGRALPENVSQEEAQRLLDTGLVEKASDIAKADEERVHEARKAEQARAEKAESPAKSQAKRA
jgi:hypothetical protein